MTSEKGYTTIPEVNSIFDYIHNERARIMKKGPQAFIGLAIAIFYYTCVPTLLYPIYLQISSLSVMFLVGYFQSILGLLTYTIVNLIMNHIYNAKYPYFEQYRIMKQKWPWEVDEVGYNKRYRQIAITTAIASNLIAPLLLFAIAYFNLVQYDTDPELFPSTKEFLTQHIICMVTFDFCFYWFHRLFHTPWLYKTFHKPHHDHFMTTAIAAIDNNPVDFIVTEFIAAISGQIIIGRMHMFTALMIHIFFVIYAVVTHSGINVPWFPWGVFPFAVGCDYHDHHHSSFVENFALFSSFWDVFCKTNPRFYKLIAEEEKKQLGKS